MRVENFWYGKRINVVVEDKTAKELSRSIPEYFEGSSRRFVI